MVFEGLGATYLGGMASALIGVVLHIVAVATPGWSTANHAWSGLFKVCSCYDISDRHVNQSAIDGVRAMVIIGALLAGVAVVLLLSHAVLLSFGRSVISKIYLIASIVCFAAVLFIFIGIIVYATEIHNEYYKSSLDLGFSFAISIIGAIFLLAGGILVFLAGRAHS